MNNLLKSRRFWTAVVGAIATLTIYFVGRYAAAGLEDVQMVLNVLLPIILVLIGAYTVDDLVATWTAAQVEIRQAELATLQQQVRLETMRSQSAKIE